MSDWWTQPSTPARQSAFSSPARASSSRARFVSDDPDPNSEAPKFLPTFAASPAAKVALTFIWPGAISYPIVQKQLTPQGSSPGAASPPAPKRSPTARFSSSINESTSSPRGNMTRYRASQADEDGIPTSSLHDDPPARAAPQGPASIPVPPALEPDADTTTLHVFGPPVEFLSTLRAYLESIGPVVSYIPGPDGSNWWVVTYGDPLAASYALRRHGEIVNGRWMLGFKIAGPGSTQGLTLVSGVGPAPVNSSAAGNAVELKSASIIRPKPKASEVAKEDYAWEEPEQPSGILGRAAELIFGR